MEQRIRRFKQTLQREMPRRGRGRRFPEDLVAEAVRIAQEARAADWSLSELAKELGVRVATLQRWCESEQERERYPAALQPVTVVPTTPSLGLETSGVVVHGPAAMRVEGLGLDELVALWRRLL